MRWTIRTAKTSMSACPPIITGTEKSEKPVIRASTVPAAIAGFMEGSVTLMSVAQTPDPLTRDASSRAGSMFWRLAATVR
jgi:hypothetical protein